MARKMLFLTLLSFLLAMGGFWALNAQDPTTQKPDTPKTEPQKTEPQKTEPQPQTTKATTTQVDLSGTYAGTFNCDAAGLTGDTTLTINGNEFTTSDGKSGRIVASRTKGYTAVALQMSGASSPVISLRGKKSGNKLTLSPVAGSTQQCTFGSSGNVAKGKSAPAATGTEVSNPAAMPAQTPSPTPSPSPEASPEPNPSPTPSGTPRPGRRPTPTPTPSPTEPMPSPTPGEPTPTPSPSPSPSPRPA